MTGASDRRYSQSNLIHPVFRYYDYPLVDGKVRAARDTRAPRQQSTTSRH